MQLCKVCFLGLIRVVRVALGAIQYAETILLNSRMERLQVELSLQVQTRRIIRHWLDKTAGDSMPSMHFALQ